MKINAEFVKMAKTITAREIMGNDLRKEREEIRDKFGYDSDEMIEWQERAEAFEKSSPYTDGMYKAYRMVDRAIDEGQEELIVNDFCWDRERSDFVKTLRLFGIETFVVTDSSTGLMEDIHGYVDEGCRMMGLTKIEKVDNFFGTRTILGIRFGL